jgi:hypothetical protein
LSNFDERIRFHINGYHHKRYVQECNEWDEQTWNEIDFRSLGSNLKRLSPSHRSQHIKFMHDLLPLGVRRFREAPIPTDELKLCPRCRMATETPSHFLQCSDDALTSSLGHLRKDLWTADIHPVRYLLYDGVHHWSTGTSTPFNPDLTHFPSHLLPYISAALRSQAAIGWHQALKGYISTHWTTLASFSMEPKKTGPDSNAAGQRIKSILRGLQEHTRRLWIHRNSVLHSNQIQEMADIRSQEIAEIKSYHSTPTSLLLSTDQHHCNRSLSRLLSSSAATRRRWLRIVKRSSAELTKDGTRQTLLTSFFTASGS